MCLRKPTFLVVAALGVQQVIERLPSILDILLMSHNLSISLCSSAQKGGFLGSASKEGIAILFPDTSPRGAGIQGEDDDWDFGTGIQPPTIPSDVALLQPSVFTVSQVLAST